MKYKVGDKVLLRDDLEIGKEYGKDSYEEDMLKGEIVTIKQIYGSFYSIGDGWNYTDEMIIGLAEDK